MWVVDHLRSSERFFSSFHISPRWWSVSPHSLCSLSLFKGGCVHLAHLHCVSWHFECGRLSRIRMDRNGSTAVCCVVLPRIGSGWLHFSTVRYPWKDVTVAREVGKHGFGDSFQVWIRGNASSYWVLSLEVSNSVWFVITGRVACITTCATKEVPILLAQPMLRVARRWIWTIAAAAVLIVILCDV